jgi:cytochrome c-type biogenesis protein CcmH/NrfF
MLLIHWPDALDSRAQSIEAQVSDQAFALSSEIMSPFCPGLTLAACPSGAAAQLRSEIASRIAAGESRSMIVEGLVARFGEGIRGSPRPRGMALSLWIVPALLGGILWAVINAAGGIQRATSHSAHGGGIPDVEPGLESRLDEELLRLG